MSETDKPTAIRNLARTRERLLVAAYEAFSSRGYAATGIRDIAAAAGVTSALIIRYFGSKSVLYAEALVNAMYGHSFFTRDRSNFGAQMAEFIAADDDRVTLMVVLALADPEAKAVSEKMVKRHILETLADWLGGEDAIYRAERMYALIVGHRVVMRELAPEHLGASTKWLADSLQAIVDDCGTG